MRTVGWVLAAGLSFAAAAASAQESCSYVARRVAGAEGIGPALAAAPGVGGRWHVLDAEVDGRLMLRSCNALGGCEMESARQAIDAAARVTAIDVASLPDLRYVAAWQDDIDQRLRIAYCADAACNSVFPRVLEPAATGQRLPAVALHTDATARIVYAQDSLAGGSLRAYTCADATCSSGTSEEIDPERVGSRIDAAMVRSAGSTALVTLFNDTDDANIRSATCTAQSCVAAQLGELAVGRDAVLLARLAPADGFDAAFTRPGGGLGLVQCNDAQCSQRSEKILLDAAHLGHHPQAVRHADGRMAISYVDTQAGDLRLYLCDNASCSIGSDVLLDDTGSADAHHALQLGNDLPFAFVRDAADGSLRAARCDAPACATPTTVASLNGLSVAHADVAVRADGRPVAVFTNDLSNGDSLHLLDCADAACGTATTRLLARTSNYLSDPVLLLRSDGRPAVYAPAVGGSEFVSCNTPTCDGVTTHGVTPPGSSSDKPLAAIVRPDGRPVLAAFERTSGGDRKLLLHQCADANCSTGAQQILAYLPADGEVFDIALGVDAANRVRIGYTHFAGASFGMTLLTCTNTDCNSVVPTPLVDGFVSNLDLAVRSSGLPLLATFDYAGVRLYDCADAGCSTHAVLPVPLTITEARTKLRLIDDVPQIGYVTDAPYHVDCLAPACTAPASQQVGSVPGTPGSAGFALRADGTPVIAAIEYGGRDLWLATERCAGPDVFADGFESP